VPKSQALPVLEGFLCLSETASRAKEQRMTIRAILFDLDNTLYPATSGVMQHIDRRIGEYVEQILGITGDEALNIRRHYYSTYGTTLRGLQQHYPHVETDEYLRFVHDVAIEEFLARDAALDDMLARLDVPKVIFTNSPREHAERVLQALGLAHHFERIFDLRYFNFVAKPDPASYAHVLDELGVEGSEALLLEDTTHNLPPAKDLGITTILIAEPEVDCPAADYHVQTVMEALKIAQTLLAPRVTRLPQPERPKTPVRVRRSA
jgi:putative hydrolase of the HAD superfamily